MLLNNFQFFFKFNHLKYKSLFFHILNKILCFIYDYMIYIKEKKLILIQIYKINFEANLKNKILYI